MISFRKRSLLLEDTSERPSPYRASFEGREYSSKACILTV